MRKRSKDAKPLVISYLRFSSAPQERGDSIKRQLEMSEKWAAERGLTITESLRDLGVSAYRGKNATEGALSAFIRLVKTGNIPKGSILLVESLDRLSRNEVRIAFQQFLEIINSGVTVVTVGDRYEYSADKCDMLALMQSLMIYSRAREESERKTQRQKAAWKSKRERAAQTGEITTALIPTWCEIKNDKIVPIPSKVAIVKRIFKMSIGGMGVGTIAAKLNEEKVYLSRKVPYIHRSTINKLLMSRMVLGEYQPTTIVYDESDKRRVVPTGSPIVGYYPAIISENSFHRAKEALTARTNHGGRVNSFVNLFAGLLRSYTDGTALWIVEKRAGQKRYMSAASQMKLDGADRGNGALPVRPFEVGVLTGLQGPGVLTDDNSAKAEEIRGQVAVVDAAIRDTREKRAIAEEALRTQEVKQTVSTLQYLNRSDAEESALQKNKDALLAQLAVVGSPTSESLADLVALIIKACDGKLTDVDRRRIQQRLKQFVDRIDVTWEKDGFGSYNVGCHVHLSTSKVVFPIAFHLRWLSERKRNAKGHLKKGWTGYRVGMLDPNHPGTSLSIRCEK